MGGKEATKSRPGRQWIPRLSQRPAWRRITRTLNQRSAPERSLGALTTPKALRREGKKNLTEKGQRERLPDQTKDRRAAQPEAIIEPSLGPSASQPTAAEIPPPRSRIGPEDQEDGVDWLSLPVAHKLDGVCARLLARDDSSGGEGPERSGHLPRDAGLARTEGR